MKYTTHCWQTLKHKSICDLTESKWQDIIFNELVEHGGEHKRGKPGWPWPLIFSAQEAQNMCQCFAERIVAILKEKGDPPKRSRQSRNVKPKPN